ncbi:MAG: hypothetical protein ABIJ23_05155 [Candidatus Magasanikbacteria bacterium]
MNEIIGHTKTLIFFDKVIENGNLSHAYLFVGPEQVGKKTIAQEIGARLLKTTREKLSTNPDYNFTTQLFDEKTGKTKKNITIAQMRGLREYLGYRPYLGGYKVAIIDGADKMNIEAANALLKTLEEPSEGTILFLITDDDVALPQTIRSRCQTIYFGLSADSDLEVLLKERKIEDKEIVKLAQGRVGRLIDWLENEGDFAVYKKEINRFNSLFGASFFEKLKSVEELFGDKSDHIGARENLDSILSIWQSQIRDRMLVDLGNKENKNLLDIEKQIVVTREFLQQNIHPRLLVENILLLIP